MKIKLQHPLPLIPAIGRISLVTTSEGWLVLDKAMKIWPCNLGDHLQEGGGLQQQIIITIIIYSVYKHLQLYTEHSILKPTFTSECFASVKWSTHLLDSTGNNYTVLLLQHL